MILRVIRMNEVETRIGDSHSGAYVKVADGLLPKPVRIGARSVGIPEHELQAVIAARIAGKSDEEIRALVAALMASREELFARILEPLGEQKLGHFNFTDEGANDGKQP